MTFGTDAEGKPVRIESGSAQEKPLYPTPLRSGLHQHLQAWYDEWLKEHRPDPTTGKPGTDLIYAGLKDPKLHQVHFVRDDLRRLIWQDIKYEDCPKEPPPREDCRVSAIVIGEHRSKSVRLPVYLLERRSLGLQLVLRYNYYDWNVSVVSDRAVPVGVLEGFNVLATEGCFYQGFPEKYVLGPFIDDPRHFSFCAYDDYELYAFVRALMSWRLDLDKPKPLFNHTRADGPFDPCPECEALMSPYQKVMLERDRKACGETQKENGGP